MNLVVDAAGFTQTVPLTSASKWLRIPLLFREYLQRAN
jgi:hypothetical protein